MEKESKTKKKRCKKRSNQTPHSDVEKITDSRYLNNKLEYEVKWKEYPDT